MSTSGNNPSKKGKPKYGGGGGAYVSKRQINGPGLWATCVRGMEKRCVPELLALLDDVADRLYPAERLAQLELLRPIKVYTPKVIDENSMETDSVNPSSSVVEAVEAVEDSEEEAEDLDESIEASIARELAELRATRPQKVWNNKGRDSVDQVNTGPKLPRVKRIRQRFESLETKTECVIFISFEYPYDPVEITERIVMDLQASGISRTKHTNRLEPVTSSCASLSIDSVKMLSTTMIEKLFTEWAQANNTSHVTYQIDPQVRLHTAPLNRSVLVEIIGSACRSLSLPPSPSSSFPSRPILTTSADLTHPNLVLVPVVQKNIFGLSIVQGKLWSGLLGRKFNLDAIAKEVRDRKLKEDESNGGGLTRVGEVLEGKREDGSLEIDIAMRN